LASPKSSTFTVPSARTLMFAGLRSRWTIPSSCAASSASAICRAIARVVDRNHTTRDALRQVVAFDQLHDQRREGRRLLEPVDRCDVWMVQGRQHFSFALKAR
jgi:hypothetical protein